MKAIVRLALLLAASFAVAPVLAAEPNFGRLFLSLEQRETLDARRRARVPDRPVAPVAAASATTRFDGHVERSGGRSTVWLNGVPTPQGKLVEGLTVTTRAGEAGRATVKSEESGQAVRMKVGETLDLGSGAVSGSPPGVRTGSSGPRVESTGRRSDPSAIRIERSNRPAETGSSRP